MRLEALKDLQDKNGIGATKTSLNPTKRATSLVSTSADRRIENTKMILKISCW